MGYATRFEGRLELDRPLAMEEAAYLLAFAGTRRFKRDAVVTAGRPDPVRQAVDLPVGEEGGLFVGGGGMLGQEPEAPDVADYNEPPRGQPHLWCPWEPTPDRRGLHVPEGGYHYGYTPWLTYMMTHILGPWSYRLAGEVRYHGEAAGDHGRVLIGPDGARRVAEGEPGINGDGYGRYERAGWYRGLGRLAEATEAYRLAAAWSPEWADPAWQHGVSLGMAGHEADGLAVMRRALGLERDPEVRARMAEALARITGP